MLGVSVSFEALEPHQARDSVHFRAECIRDSL